MTKNANTNEANIEKSSAQKDFFSWAGANFLTKALGYLRDAMLVAVFGGGALTDAYYAAFRITNLFRRTLGEGGLNAVFIPGYAVERNKGGCHAGEFASRFWTATLFGSMAAVIAGIIFCRPLTYMTAAGFAGLPEYFTFTALLTAVFAPHFLFVNVSAYFTALLNSSNIFFLPAISQAVFSISVLLALISYKFGPFASIEPKKALLIVAAAASISGIIQVAMVIPSLKKSGFSLKFSALKDSIRVFPLVFAAVPATAVLAQEQISLLIDTCFASFLPEGSITAIYNASRLTQFPVSMFAAAAAATALPYLSRFSAEKNNVAFNAHLYRAVFTSQLMLFPSAFGLAALSMPICSLLFMHGNFTLEQTSLTANVLIYACIGLPAFGLNKVMASALYARGHKKMPALVIAGQLAANIILCFILMKPLGAPGLMLATSISSIAAAAAFLAIAWRLTGFNAINKSMAKTVLCAAAAGGCAWVFAWQLDSFWAPVIFGIPAAAILYFIGLAYLNISERKLLIGNLI